MPYAINKLLQIIHVSLSQKMESQVDNVQQLQAKP